MANPDPKREEIPAALRPGTSFGDYDIVRCIGIGGMGSVFEATHRLMARRVALKVLHTSIPTTAELDPRARFLREGAMLVRVQHPNVVAVYDAGTIGDQPYLAMELLEGATFDRVVASTGRMSPKRAVDLVADAAEGLEAAHVQGIVHRDVKPENLFVARDRRGAESAKIVDFGIAKDFRGGGGRNTAIGTPAYMSPEQLLGGHPVDGRCDQYALAVVLYEALTGTRPYDAPSLVELAIKLERGEAEPPSRRGAPISAALDAVVMRALAVDPNHRFPSMATFATALRSATTGGFVVEGGEELRSTTPSEAPVGFAPTRAFRRSSVPPREVLPPVRTETSDREPVAEEPIAAIATDGRSVPTSRAPIVLGAIGFLLVAFAIGWVATRDHAEPAPAATTPTMPDHASTTAPAPPVAPAGRVDAEPALAHAADADVQVPAPSDPPRPRAAHGRVPAPAATPEPAPALPVPTGLIFER